MHCTLTQFQWTTCTYCINTTYLLSLDTIQCTSTTLHMYNLLDLCTTICCTTNLIRTLKCFLLFSCPCCVLGSLSCWKTQPPPIFNALTKGRRLLAKSYILVSSDHMTFSHASSGSSRWSLVDFRRAWTCAGLSRGTLCMLQDFIPWRCSVLLMVTVETVVPALFRSLTRSFRVVLGWSLNFLRIINTPRGEILHETPVRGTLTVIKSSHLYLYSAFKNTNCVKATAQYQNRKIVYR